MYQKKFRIHPKNENWEVRLWWDNINFWVVKIHYENCHNCKVRRINEFLVSAPWNEES